MTPEPCSTEDPRRCSECRGTGMLPTGCWRVSPLLTVRLSSACRWCRGTGERPDDPQEPPR